MRETRHTFCRICEASCGLEVDVEDSRVVDIRPRKSHIGTLGFSCMKGLHQHRMYDSPDRLTTPLKRIGDGFEPVSWQTAISEIGSKVRALRKISPQSIGMYVGTAAGFSLLHPIFAEGFMQGIGSHNIYSSATQDCANRFAAAQAMYGFPFFQPFPDLDNIECLVLVGTNPVVSKWTFLQVAHPVKRLKEVRARGGRVIVVDPRRTETAKVAGEHIAIKPTADVFFFASLLNVLLEQGVDEAAIRGHMDGLEEVRRIVADWSPEKTVAVTGVEPRVLRDLADSIRNANGAAIVTGTGIGMGGNGTLAHWLAEVINAVTGNLDRRGGTLVGDGIFDFPALSQKQGLFNREARSRIGGFRELNGGFPGAILADEILTPGEDQLKALFVTGGNPLMTMANSGRLRDALGELDMLVVTDIYLNETASLADYVLPATSPLERHDLPFVFPLFLGMQSIPYLAATEPVVPPPGDARDEATIYTDLATASGVSLFGSSFVQGLMRLMKGLYQMRGGSGLPQRWLLDGILRLSGAPRFGDLLQHPDGLPTPGARPGSFLGTKPLTPGARVQLAPAELVAEAPRLTREFEAKQTETAFRLITRRAHNTHNSWTQNIPELTNGNHNASNACYLHPEDAVMLGLGDGDAVDINHDGKAIRLPVRLLDTLMRGVVAVPHGWGHQHAEGLANASRLSGANVNILASDGPANCEPVSGMAHLTGLPVTLSRSDQAIDSTAWDGIGQQSA